MSVREQAPLAHVTEVVNEVSAWALEQAIGEFRKQKYTEARVAPSIAALQKLGVAFHARP